ncbi:MAG: DUF1885 family protein [Bacillota bacterium]|nr:DUF1885 family protein [Bacillota bacterium]
MAENAYIKLVAASSQKDITIDEVKQFFHYYKEITAKTGDQLGWKYEEVSFPYSIKETEEGKDKWFYLHSENDRYYAMIIGADKETVLDENGVENEQSYIQITLPEGSTFGDKGKANEFCKFLANKLKGELHLFNGRIMYYYPRK